MKNKKLLVLAGSVCLVLVLAALPLMAACAPEEKPAPTPAPPEVKAPLKIFWTSDRSGPYAAGMVKQAIGTEAYLDILNEKGGIEGHPVELVWVDDGGDVSRSLANYERRPEDTTVVWTNKTAAALVLKDRLAEDGLVGVETSADSGVVLPPGNYFAVCTLYDDMFGGYCDWIMENWRGPEPPKIAFVTPEGPMGEAPIELGTKYARMLGMEVLPTEFVPIMAMDVTPQITRLNNLGVDYVYCNSVGVTSGPIMRDVRKLGLQDRITVAGYAYNWPPEVIGTVGPEGAEGLLWICPWYLTTDETPGINQLREYTSKHGQEFSETCILGAGIAEVTCEALRRTLKAVGYEGLTGTALKKYGFQTMDNFRGTQLLATTRWTENERGASDDIRIVQYQSGKPVPITDWRTCPRLIPKEYRYLFPGAVELPD